MSKWHAWYSVKAHKLLLVDGNVQIVTIDGKDKVATCIGQNIDFNYAWDDKVYLGEFNRSKMRTVLASRVGIER